MEELKSEAIALLKQLISIPSYSLDEGGTASLIEDFLKNKGLVPNRQGNNIWAFLTPFEERRPTIWLNSHHDTVKPNTGYSQDPFTAISDEGKIFGLGSNDAGGSLVALITAFCYFLGKDLPFNLLLIASAEEEISGPQGISSLIPILPPASLVLVGEPTQMKLAVAEKGLLVLDGTVKGIAGHAAREEGSNAIYLALNDLEKVKNFRFQRVSPFLGPTKVSCTVLHAGELHNMVPEMCRYVLDVRVNELYTHEEVLEELKAALTADLVPRSMRLKASNLPKGHLLHQVAVRMGLEMFGSPTLSDQALIPYPSAKIGPGDSARSHTADEFIFIHEIQESISIYISILENYASLYLQNEHTQ
ncbi:MAG: M20/M25/M40 family metallo-hydrolase [Bacteroidetes bacterium]|nr:M20/M25/M40 family metallo-hydrolase [Bacteroidota bacterium]MDA1268094.1 M20/M25/M40 family metallo-hydrolase [Bacteroidota bacterium]